MAGQTFINLPVKNLAKTIEFFTQLGFKFNPEFTDQNATCLILSKNSFAMLLTKKFFKTFLRKTEVCDSSKCTESIISLALSSRREVDDMVKMALVSGGKRYKEPELHGEAMYSDSFQDPSGHLWKVFYMDMAKFRKEFS